MRSRHVFHFVNVIQQRNLQRRLLKVNVFLDPGHVLQRPVFLHVLRWALAMPQQELAQAVTSAVLILPGVFASSHQIAQRLVVGVGDPHRCKIAGTIAARQFRGIAPIRLDAIAGFDRHQARRHHFTSHAQRGELPVQDVARGTGFVADPQLLRRAQFRHQLANRFQAVRNDAQRTNFPVRLCYRNRDGVRVDIQTHKSYLRHATNSFRMRLCAAVLPTHSVTRDTARRGWSPHCD